METRVDSVLRDKCIKSMKYVLDNVYELGSVYLCIYFAYLQYWLYVNKHFNRKINVK